MMDDITQEQIKAQLRTLPQAVREYLADPATEDRIALIGNKYKFTKVETGLLAQVTSMLIIGLLKPTEFIASLIDYLALSRETAVLLAQDINRDIFNPVKDLLKQIHHLEQPAAILSPIQPASPVIPLTFPAQNEAPTKTTPGSIFEQKLGGAFRMSTGGSSAPSMREPKLIIPSEPHAALPPNNDPKIGGSDQYRESVN